MIYEVTKGEQEFEVDDLVLFDKQPLSVQRIFNDERLGDTAVFDNCSMSLLTNGRIIITPTVNNIDYEV
ncbi:hypothetical protein [Dysgonomonas reticulitermitis]